ncbi:MAG: AraC family transcriptional regulator [Clostridia bacterium]
MNRFDYELTKYDAENKTGKTVFKTNHYYSYLVLKGYFTFIINDIEYQVAEGDLICIGLLNTFTVNEKQNRLTNVILELKVSQKLIETLEDNKYNLHGCFDNSLKRNVNALTFDHMMFLNILSKRLASFKNEEDMLNIHFEKCTVEMMINSINRAFFASDSNKNGKLQYGNRLIDNAITYVHENLPNNLSIESIANTLYVSEEHLCRTFKKNVGITLHAYINSKRLERAIKLMKNGMPFKEVFFHTGFNNYNNFYKLFKSVYGQSPKKYIESLAEKNKLEENYDKSIKNVE